MNIDQAFPSNFLKAADLGNHTPRVTIESVEMTTLQDGTKKPMMSFVGKQKALILNKTNSNKIRQAYGNETDNWIGKDLILYGALVEFGGEEVEAIRVRIPASAKGQPSKPVPAASPPRPAPDYQDHEDPAPKQQEETFSDEVPW